MTAISWPRNVPLTQDRLRGVLNREHERNRRPTLLILTHAQRSEALRMDPLVQEYTDPLDRRSGEEFVLGLQIVVPEEAQGPRPAARQQWTTVTAAPSYISLYDQMIRGRLSPPETWDAHPPPRPPAPRSTPATLHSNWDRSS